jgi:phage terminase large subunit
MYRGSEGVDFPEAVYEPSQHAQIREQITNDDAFRNKRCQYYFQLRDRVYRTYRAVAFNEYHDPDKLISFSSNIKILPKLRAELCRMPVKPNGNGLFDLYTKQQMKDKFKFKSPNLADSVVMSLRFIQPTINTAVRRPAPNRPMRLR